MSITLSGDIGTIITAIGTVAIGVLQVLQARRSRENGRKIDENTALTKDTAAKVEVVHAATTAIAESTGTHQTLKEGG